MEPIIIGCFLSVEIEVFHDECEKEVPKTTFR